MATYTKKASGTNLSATASWLSSTGVAGIPTINDAAVWDSSSNTSSPTAYTGSLSALSISVSGSKAVDFRPMGTVSLGEGGLSIGAATGVDTSNLYFRKITAAADQDWYLGYSNTDIATLALFEGLGTSNKTIRVRSLRGTTQTVYFPVASVPTANDNFTGKIQLYANARINALSGTALKNGKVEGREAGWSFVDSSSSGGLYWPIDIYADGKIIGIIANTSTRQIEHQATITYKASTQSTFEGNLWFEGGIAVDPNLTATIRWNNTPGVATCYIYGLDGDRSTTVIFSIAHAAPVYVTYDASRSFSGTFRVASGSIGVFGSTPLNYPIFEQAVLLRDPTDSGSLSAVSATDPIRLGSLQGSGPLTIGNASGISVGYLNDDDQYDGVISGSYALNKEGTGTWTVTGAWTKTGTVRVKGGTFYAQNPQAFGTSANVAVDTGARVLTNIAFSKAYVFTLSGTFEANYAASGRSDGTFNIPKSVSAAFRATGQTPTFLATAPIEIDYTGLTALTQSTLTFRGTTDLVFEGYISQANGSNSTFGLNIVKTDANKLTFGKAGANPGDSVTYVAFAMRQGTLALLGTNPMRVYPRLTQTGGDILLGDGVVAGSQTFGFLEAASGGTVKNGTTAGTLGTLTISTPNAADGGKTFFGVIGGSTAAEKALALTKTGNFDWYIAGAQTYTGATNITGTGALDGTGSLASAVTLGTGVTVATIGAGRNQGLGDFTIPSLALGYNGILRASKKDAQTDASKLIIMGTLSASTARSFKVKGAGTGWAFGVPQKVATFGSKDSTVSLGMEPWTDSVYPRIGGSATVGSVQILNGNEIWMTPGVVSTAALTWDGGASGEWSVQGSGFLNGANADLFFNTDAVRFGANTTTAVLTSDVTVSTITSTSPATPALVFDATYAHTITTSTGKKITNTGTTQVLAGTQTQTLSVEASHVQMTVAGPLAVGHALALTRQGLAAASVLNLSGGGSLSNVSGADVTSALGFTFSTTANGVSSIDLGTAGKTMTFSGAITGLGAATATTNVSGRGVLDFAGTAAYSTSNIAAQKLNVTGTTAGETVLRMGSGSNPLPNAAVVTLAGGAILENRATGNFARPLKTAPTAADFAVGAGGGGFSAYVATFSVQTALTFGTGTDQWNGPIYFGTAYGTSRGKVAMTAATMTIATGVDQIFHVFAGDNAYANSSRAEIVSPITSAGNVIVRKRGPGTAALISGTGNPYTGQTVVESGEIETQHVQGLGSGVGTDVVLQANTVLRARKPASGTTLLKVKSLNCAAGSRLILGGA